MSARTDRYLRQRGAHRIERSGKPSSGRGTQKPPTPAAQTSGEKYVTDSCQLRGRVSPTGTKCTRRGLDQVTKLGHKGQTLLAELHTSHTNLIRTCRARKAQAEKDDIQSRTQEIHDIEQEQQYERTDVTRPITRSQAPSAGEIQT